MARRGDRNLRGRLVALGSSARYGRLRARVPRYAFLLFVVVMCAIGIRSTLSPPSIGTSGERSDSSVDFAAQSFALEFARSYLTYDSARPAEREAALAVFAPSGLQLEAGFTPPAHGSQRVVWADSAQIQQRLLGGSIITVAAKLSTAAEPVYLSVPVSRDSGGALYLDGYPAFVGPPLSAHRSAERAPGRPVVDSEVTGLVERALGNYLGGDGENLSADLAAAATVTLPTSPLQLQAVQQINWVDGNGGGAVFATVDAVDSRGGRYTLAYEVGVRRVGPRNPQIGPGWRVTYVQTISQES